MQVSIDREALGTLLSHAASAARIVGNLDDPIAAGPLADHIDTIVHGLSELLGDPRTLATPDAVAPDDRVAYDGRASAHVQRRAPMTPRRFTRGKGRIHIKLCDEASVNTRKALLFLADRSTPAQLAEALGMTMDALWKARAPSRWPAMRLAIRVARAAQVNLEDVLTGAWPGDRCPKYGRKGEDNDADSITRRRNHVSHLIESAKLAVRAAAYTREGLRGFLGRLLGWSDERAVELGLRSLALALAHRSARAGTSSPLAAIGKAGGCIGWGGAL